MKAPIVQDKQIKAAVRNVQDVMAAIPAKVHTADEITKIVMMKIADESHKIVDGGAEVGHNMRQDIRFEIRVRIARDFTKMAIAKARK